MKNLTFNLLGEDISIPEAIERLEYQESQEFVLRELGKRVLIEHFIREYNITVTDDECNQILFEFRKRMDLRTDEDIKRFLMQNKVDKDQVVSRLVYLEKLKKMKMLVISEQMIRDNYLKQKIRKDLVLFGVIKVSNEALAKELYFRIKDDKQDFAELAKEFSEGNEKENGGLVGPVPLLKLNPELREALSTLEEGQIKYPINIDGKAFLIIKLIRLDSMPFSPQIEENIRTELFDQWIEHQLNMHKMHNLDSLESEETQEEDNN